MLKREREGNDSLEADMWCHFGAAIIRGASTGNLRFIYLYTWLTCYITNLRRNWLVEMVHRIWVCVLNIFKLATLLWTIPFYVFPYLTSLVY